jgi:plastocyanin
VSNKILIGIIVIVVVVGGVYFLSRNQYPASQTQPVAQQSATSQPQTAAQADTITIQNFTFNPGTLTVKQGTKVTWTNQDSAPHKIKSATFNSGELKQGDTFDFTFNDKGSFDYSCSIHPSMTGKIVVE